MTSRTLPSPAAGLYDPRYEHDACGVGMVARLDNQPTHEVVTRALSALENLEHRGASGADPLHRRRRRNPDADARRAAARPSRASSCPPPGAYGVLMCFLPTDEQARRACRVAAGRHGRGRGPARARLARGAGLSRAHRGNCRAPVALRSASCSSPRADGIDQDAFERKLYVIRRVAEQAVAASRDAGAGFYVTSSSSRTINYKGMLISYQLGRLLPRPARRALQERAGAGALALLDQHLPQLGARPSLPRDLPQRRDQHGDGQRQLDARARVRARKRAVRRGPAEDPAGRHPGQLGLGDVRQRARAADARRALAAARGDDDDPRGLPQPRAICPRS